MASVNMGTIVHQQWPGVVTTNVEHFQSPQSLKEIQQYSSPQSKKKEDRTKSDVGKFFFILNLTKKKRKIDGLIFLHRLNLVWQTKM